MRRLGRPIIAAALHQASLLRRPSWQPLARRGLPRALCTAEEPRTAGTVAAADAAVTTVDSEAAPTATRTSTWEALGRLLPHANLNRLVAQFPGVLDCEPSALLSRINALADALPGQNVLRAVERCPTILQLSEEELRRRVHALVAATPRQDMARVVAESPELLEVPPEQVGGRENGQG